MNLGACMLRTCVGGRKRSSALRLPVRLRQGVLLGLALTVCTQTSLLSHSHKRQGEADWMRASPRAVRRESCKLEARPGIDLGVCGWPGLVTWNTSSQLLATATSITCT